MTNCTLKLSEFPDAAACRDPRPAYVAGGFQHSVTAYAVAEDGELTLLGKSNQCTYAGDAPSRPVPVPSEGRVLIVTVRHGNGSARWADLYEQDALLAIDALARLDGWSRDDLRVREL